MTCNFTSFLTVTQSYQDDVWMIMEGCVQWNSVYGGEDFTSSEDQKKGGAHPAPFAASFFPDSKKLPIYCWVDRESFPVVG